ncbi:hypothetical protein [Neptuniibacter sp. QD37_11]|uniref:hypothetical protein n=1 Tax=Neptuniibacter sp. QD37_11 TaxID=3398209 RepID=UPI0039F4A689
MKSVVLGALLATSISHAGIKLHQQQGTAESRSFFKVSAPVTYHNATLHAGEQQISISIPNAGMWVAGFNMDKELVQKRGKRVPYLRKSSEQEGLLSCVKNYCLVAVPHKKIRIFGTLPIESVVPDIDGNMDYSEFEVRNAMKTIAREKSAYLLTREGTLRVLGDNHYGQLGLSQEFSRADQWALVARGVYDIAAGDKFAAIIKKDRSVWVSGAITGHKASNRHKFSAAFKGAKKIYANKNLLAVLNQDDDLYVIGSIGRTPKQSRVFHQWTKLRSSVKTVSIGDNHIAAVDLSGDLYMMGVNDENQFGRKSKAFHSNWVYCQKNISQVAAGAGFTVAMRKDGVLLGAGRNNEGQLGLGKMPNAYYWQRILNVPWVRR